VSAILPLLGRRGILRAGAAGKAVLSGGGTFPFPFTYNLSPTTLPIWRAAKQALLAGGTTRPKIIIAADSTGMGWGAGVGTAYTGARALSTAAALASGLTARGIPATVDNWSGFGIGGGQTFANIHAYDPRSTPVSGWAATTTPAIIWFGGGFIHSGNPVSTFPFVPANSFDRITITWLQFSGGGSFNINVDGGASLGLINTANATQALVSQTFTVPAGTHTINLVPTSTTASYIMKCVPWLSASPAVDILIGAWGGATAADWADVSVPQSAANAIAFEAPTLTIFKLGTNDENNGLTPAFKTNMQVPVDKAKITGDILFEMHPPCNDAGNIANQATTQAYYRDLCGTNSCGMVDWLQKYGDWTNLNDLGLAYDSKHQNANYQAMEGDYLAQILAAA